jgi:hypothetical protein
MHALFFYSFPYPRLYPFDFPKETKKDVFLHATLWSDLMSADINENRMKNLLIIVVGLVGLLIISCKKTSTGAPDTLSLIQHKWMIISVNGEALRYVGTANDYFNFSTNGFLYIYMGSRYDTSAYTLLSDNITLLLYPVTNGIKSNVALNSKIKVLTNNQFIFAGSSGVINSIDSLKR